MGAETKERPILFSGPMVRAIRDGRKTQTRRVVRPQPDFATAREALGGDTSKAVVGVSDMVTARAAIGLHVRNDFGTAFGYVVPNILCPYGRPGDRLWVRETWEVNPNVPSMSRGARLAAHHRRYRADGVEPFLRWHPSIHMPRWVSRLTLDVVAVRVERLQEISESDAIAEGRSLTPGDERGYFPETWDEINAKRGHSWHSNPWVWVIEFSPVPAPQ